MELLSLNKSYFEIQRLRYRPETLFLLETIRSKHIQESHPSSYPPRELKEQIPNLCRIPEVSIYDQEATSSKPLKIGVLLSGGQAPGGHNVVIGLFDALRAFNPKTRLFGFVKGPLGLTRGLYKDLDISVIYDYYNMGGFDMLSSSREKIKTEEQKKIILNTVKKLKLDGLLIIGGNNSNTDTAMLAEYFLSQNCKIPVIGVPKTIDGDLKNSWIETPLGFHTSCRTYSEMIGNLAKDALSTKKYHHFIRLMGQQASYTTLECGLQTLPNIVLISEHIATRKTSLKKLSEHLALGLVHRYRSGKNYSTVLIPEGLIEHIFDTRTLIDELNILLANGDCTIEKIITKLSRQALQTFYSLPKEISNQILLARDSHGNVRVSKIATEELLATMVEKEIKKIEPNMEFQSVSHFFGYEARAGFPSNFDCNYGIALGIVSALFLVRKKTGYMITINNLAEAYNQWQGGATPLYKMMHIESRCGIKTPVIKTDLVNPEAPAVQYLLKQSDSCLIEDLYCFPGPLQYFGQEELIDQRPLTLIWENQSGSPSI
ncbi:6-phosphofructokinase,diphosphate--fructose-6-phosphate 1-phosphotransferase,diphosphate--fructose-6-phosphate 1-phosphotransferase,Phosphofructokinase [Chlamydia serpentis]|uniref:6-phosphofructokinase n=1 Tax=Chlamydia serpentis TaxID=1967782 RepID=A0A2R8FA59_9CHLA|nr:diphosphate--fructose-6-phosphate 1-phosphotransferase [Chlamydia serpentis]SPN73318.1 6-phosphofructokinase,diphosphate--fructose-6-phosphate 1-phosphotransferase,diphosphate--fructose-6-phosphate 1-phosphotransferase,Phosphofructokinase [Chlamydia serpentis]